MLNSQNAQIFSICHKSAVWSSNCMIDGVAGDTFTFCVEVHSWDIYGDPLTQGTTVDLLRK